jgi:RNA polymerase-binding transcription factor DksA
LLEDTLEKCLDGFWLYVINNAHKYEQPKSKEQKKYEELKAKQDERNKLNNITLPELTDERFFELTSDTINNHINYHDYLRTEKWEILREKVYERENGICEQCKTNIRLEGIPFCIHHISGIVYMQCRSFIENILLNISIGINLFLCQGIFILSIFYFIQVVPLIHAIFCFRMIGSF